MALTRLKGELEMFEEEASDYCAVELVNDDIFHWEALIIGPKDSPYEDGLFRIDIQISENYPKTKPNFKFLTKIYHPNISESGQICTSLLNNWKETFTISDALCIIVNLLSNPNPNSPWGGICSDCANDMKNDHSKYMSTARSWTSQYARK